MNVLNIGIVGIGNSGIKTVSDISKGKINNDEASFKFWKVCNDDTSNITDGSLYVVALPNGKSQKIVESVLSNIDFLIICTDASNSRNYTYAYKLSEMAKTQDSTVCCIIAYNEDDLTNVDMQVSELTLKTDAVIYARSDNNMTCEAVLHEAMCMIAGMMDQESIIMCSPDDIMYFLKNSGEAHFMSITISNEGNVQTVISRMEKVIPSGISLGKANKVILRLTMSKDIPFSDIDNLINVAADLCGDDAELIFGAYFDGELADSTITLSLVATDFIS